MVIGGKEEVEVEVEVHGARSREQGAESLGKGAIRKYLAGSFG